jgi:hypothetical protein
MEPPHLAALLPAPTSVSGDFPLSAGWKNAKTEILEHSPEHSNCLKVYPMMNSRQ